MRKPLLCILSLVIFSSIYTGPAIAQYQLVEIIDASAALSGRPIVDMTTDGTSLIFLEQEWDNYGNIGNKIIFLDRNGKFLGEFEPVSDSGYPIVDGNALTYGNSRIILSCYGEGYTYWMEYDLATGSVVMDGASFPYSYPGGKVYGIDFSGGKLWIVTKVYNAGVAIMDKLC